MPPEVRAELDRRLIEGSFSGYRALAKWLGEQGCSITPSAVQRYGSQLELKLEAVKLATQQARAVVKASPDDDGKMNEALLRLVQQHLFYLLVELKTADVSKVNLAALARSVAQMARASVIQRKFAEEMRAKVAQRVGAAQRKVVQAVREAAAGGSGGLSPQAEEAIRRALMEITE